MNQQALSEWLVQLNSQVEQTNHSYPRNLVQGWPIPFFGDILRARVLTVGVNPSDKEFGSQRRGFPKDFRIRHSPKGDDETTDNETRRCGGAKCRDG